MKKISMLAMAFACLAYAAGAAADSTAQVVKREAPKGITTTFYSCIDKAGSDTIAIGACLSAEKATQDGRLNTTYKALLGKLKGKAKEQLVSAERAWLDSHNKNGDFEVSLYGDGSAADMQVTQNEIFRLCERANTLEKYLSIANDQ
jgi:uncharacterized protein YecT (DUF1311 family)